MHDYSTCFGGGGFLAIAFGIGVAHGLDDAGVAVAEGPMLGTSGGAWAASALATCTEMEAIVELTSTGTERGLSHPQMVRHIFGDLRDGRVSTVAIDRLTGRRHVLRGHRTDLADAVGASSAAPGMFPPYAIGKRRYIDGGLYSPTSAHRAAPAANLVVIAPMSGPNVRPAHHLFDRQARNEAVLWRLRNRGRVVYITPDEATRTAAGRGWRGLIDPTTTAAVYRTARELGRQRGEALAAGSSMSPTLDLAAA
jgi:predicted acylesterase/phospholipase RssA